MMRANPVDMIAEKVVIEVGKIRVHSSSGNSPRTSEIDATGIKCTRRIEWTLYEHCMFVSLGCGR